MQNTGRKETAALGSPSLPWQGVELAAESEVYVKLRGNCRKGSTGVD